jgi:hypothetical protein
MRRMRIVYLGFVALTLIVCVAGQALADSPLSRGVKLQRLGSPIWRPVDAHLITAPIGTADSDYAEFATTAFSLLPPPNHVFHPDLFVGPGAPHAGFDAEFASGITANGYREGFPFSISEFSNGNGVWLIFMVVPAPGVTGSSPDFASGPIIPNSLFPIAVSGRNIHNGTDFSAPSAFTVPPLDANLNPPFAVDGHSHFPVFFADNADFGAPGAKLPGAFEYAIRMTDVTGNGWLIRAHFTVTP